MAKSKSKPKVGAKIRQTGKELKQTADSFLAGKPLWVWALSYAAVAAVLCLVFCLALLFGAALLDWWWVLAILFVAVGAVWGALDFSRKQK